MCGREAEREKRKIERRRRRRGKKRGKGRLCAVQERRGREREEGKKDDKPLDRSIIEERNHELLWLL